MPNHSDTEIHRAAKCGTTQDLNRILIAHPEAIDRSDSSGCDPLHIAAKTNNKEAVTYLIRHGADVEGITKTCSYTPLHHAVLEGHTEMVNDLISHHRANLSARTKEGLTPLLLATKHKQKAVLHCLLKHHADVNERTPDGGTALHIAAKVGHKEAVDCLLK